MASSSTDFLMMGVINNTASQIIMLRQRPQMEERGVMHKMHITWLSLSCCSLSR